MLVGHEKDERTAMRVGRGGELVGHDTQEFCPRMVGCIVPRMKLVRVSCVRWVGWLDQVRRLAWVHSACKIHPGVL